MTPVETLQRVYRLSDRDAEFIASMLLPDEETLTDVGPKMQEWLKLKARESDYEFMAASVRGNTLLIYVRVDADSIGPLPFEFIGNHPLDELWRASVSASFKEHFHTQHFTFTPHRPN